MMGKILVKDVKFDDIDKTLDKYIESGEFEDNLEEYEIRNKEMLGDDLVLLDSPAWRVVDKGLIFVEGVCFSLQNSNYEPDWSITMVYKDVPDEELDLSKFIYYESGSPSSAVHNCFCTMDL